MTPVRFNYLFTISGPWTCRGIQHHLSWLSACLHLLSQNRLISNCYLASNRQLPRKINKASFSQNICCNNILFFEEYTYINLFLLTWISKEVFVLYRVKYFYLLHFRPSSLSCGPGVDSASNRTEHQEYLFVGSGCRCAGLTTLPQSRADCL
jgi:hypothetical protein